MNIILTGTEKFQNFPKVIQEIVQELTREAETEMKRVAPYKSGRLRGSIRPTQQTDTSAHVGPHVIYGAVQNFGWPPPHTMRGSFKGHHYAEQTAEHLDANGQKIVDAILSQHFGD